MEKYKQIPCNQVIRKIFGGYIFCGMSHNGMVEYCCKCKKKLLDNRHNAIKSMKKEKIKEWLETLSKFKEDIQTEIDELEDKKDFEYDDDEEIEEYEDQIQTEERRKDYAEELGNILNEELNYREQNQSKLSSSMSSSTAKEKRQ